MARGGYRAGAGRPRKASSTGEKKRAARLIKSTPDMTPLEYMLSVMRDEGADDSRRDRMACAAAAYIHEKASEKKLGKKEQREEAAKKSKDVFSGTRSMPRLVIDND